MSLDPRDSQRRGRSRSPGGRERERSSTRVEPEREHTRVRDSSPPSSRYDDDPRARGYDYDEDAEFRTRERRRDPDVVAADPRERGHGGVGQYRSSSPARGSRADPYAVPGAFDERDEVKVGYGGSRGEKEKGYYAGSGYGGRRDGYGPDRPRYDDTERYQVPDPRDKEKDSRRYEEDRYRPERTAGFGAHGAHSSISAVDYDDRRPSSHAQPPSPVSKYSYDHKPAYAQPPSPVSKYAPDDYRSSYRHSPSPPASKYDRDDHRPSHAEPPSPASRYAQPPPLPSYADPKKWEYAQPDEDLKYTRRQAAETAGRPASPPRAGYGSSGRPRHGGAADYGVDSARSSKSNVVTVEPGSRNRRDASPAPGSRSKRDSSPPHGLAPRGTHSLSVSTGHHGSTTLSLAHAPGSPLQEAYHGTYQSISPMPSPLMIAATPHNELDVIQPLSPASSDDEKGHAGGKKARRTARFHDPEEEALMLAKALKGERRTPDTGPLVDVLPGLTHDQVLELRVQYKKIVKTGSERKGVNIAKHIKMRLKDEDPSLMKACYSCALGKWESEAYWANFWYQGEKSRRELLIESLMGRTNEEIREIKDCFADKKYHDSLTRCMRTELKEDKFKKAVLMVLEEKRMDERPGDRINRHLVEDDVRELHKAVRADKGGETAIISIVVVRGDHHLREVLKVYESTYRANFAREMLKKSGNLVGEMLAHILNGVINKPVRDALLIQHALSLSKSDSIRTELLISRLVRYHWDRPHMELVKKEYRARYGVEMQAAVKEGTRGEWGRFCEMLCVRRMGDEVRRLERVEEVSYVRR